MPLYSPNSVERIVIELTANCNAMCPGCDRWNKGDGGLNAVVEQHLGRAGHMTLRKFNNAIHNDLFLHHPEFRTIEFNGSVGDAILHPLFINFIKLVNKKNDQFRKENSKENPRVRLKLATNAGLHGKKFWTEVAKQFIASGRHQNHLIMVALDGTTNETHQQYRRGVDFNKALVYARYIDVIQILKEKKDYKVDGPFMKESIKDYIQDGNQGALNYIKSRKDNEYIDMLKEKNKQEKEKEKEKEK